MLVAAMVGLDAWPTMDLDATVRGASANVEDIVDEADWKPYLRKSVIFQFSLGGESSYLPY